MEQLPVHECVCHGVSFAELLRLHRETGATVEELSRVTGCGTSCGMCLPYIRVALATGRARLPVMGEAELKRAAGLQ